MEEDILNYSPTVMFRGTPCGIGKGCHCESDIEFLNWRVPRSCKICDYMLEIQNIFVLLKPLQYEDL